MMISFWDLCALLGAGVLSLFALLALIGLCSIGWGAVTRCMRSLKCKHDSRGKQCG